MTYIREPLQSAYKRLHNTETALLKVNNDILNAINRHRTVALLLLDLSAAFDTVDHKLLLHRLRVRFGIGGKALAWFGIVRKHGMMFHFYWPFSKRARDWVLIFKID